MNYITILLKLFGKEAENMKKGIFGKSCCFAIIILFVGTSIVPSVMSIDIKKTSIVATMSTTWIVDDEGDGNFTEIQDAIDNASDGDTIYVYSGEYSRIFLSHRNSLNLMGIPEEYGNGSDTGCPIIDGEYLTHVVNLEWSDRNNIDGFNIINCGISAKNAGIFLQNSNYNSITNNNVTNNKIGLYLDYSNYNGIWFNSICENDETGVSMVSAHKNLVSHNQINNNNANGIVTDSANQNTIVWNNITYNGRGIYTWQITITPMPALNIIKHNNIFGNGLRCRNQFSFSIWRNNYWGDPGKYHLIRGIPPRLDYDSAPEAYEIP